MYPARFFSRFRLRFFSRFGGRYHRIIIFFHTVLRNLTAQRSRRFSVSGKNEHTFHRLIKAVYASDIDIPPAFFLRAIVRNLADHVALSHFRGLHRNTRWFKADNDILVLI